LKASGVKKQIELQAATEFNGGGHLNVSCFGARSRDTN
jgi:hypothetical protein